MKTGCLEVSIGIGVFLVIIFGIVLYIMRKKYETDLENISENLERLLQKKEVVIADREDTLYSKINMQIQRIGDINIANTRQSEKERDELKQLLAEISHQLRTPLANMEVYLELLQALNETSAEQKEYLDAVAQAEEKIAFLVEKFIVTARMEQKMIQIHKADADIKETVSEAIFQVRKKAEQKHIDIAIQEQEKMNYKVFHDRNWICECIYNLLDNSIKYSPEGSRILVYLKNNEMFTEIAVDDEGMGIMDGEENKIFQLFYRGARALEQPGYGIGLYLTREIVRKHDGFMQVKRKKKGIRMSIFLPK